MKNYVDKDKLQEYTTKLTAKNKTIFATKEEVGSPLVASTVAEMTDQNRVYVYVGSESGYTSGNWYYYDGSAWTSGGIYNSAAIQTDSTLSIAGKAADAKAVGDALANVEIEVDATLTQAGMAADAKATGDAINDLKSATDNTDNRMVAAFDGGVYYLGFSNGTLTRTASGSDYYVTRTANSTYCSIDPGTPLIINAGDTIDVDSDFKIKVCYKIEKDSSGAKWVKSISDAVDQAHYTFTESGLYVIGVRKPSTGSSYANITYTDLVGKVYITTNGNLKSISDSIVYTDNRLMETRPGWFYFAKFINGSANMTNGHYVYTVTAATCITPEDCPIIANKGDTIDITDSNYVITGCGRVLKDSTGLKVCRTISKAIGTRHYVFEESGLYIVLIRKPVPDSSPVSYSNFSYLELEGKVKITANGALFDVPQKPANPYANLDWSGTQYITSCHAHCPDTVAGLIGAGYTALIPTNYRPSKPYYPLKAFYPSVEGIENYLSAPNSEVAVSIPLYGTTTKAAHFSPLGSYFALGTASSSAYSGLFDQFINDCRNTRKGWFMGGVIINHPELSGLSADDMHDALARYSDILGIEVYNYGAEVSDSKGSSFTQWDAILSSGLQCFGFAAPDHAIQSSAEPNTPYGFIHVIPSCPTDDALLAAIGGGRFYSSFYNDSLKFTKIALSSSTLTVTASVDTQDNPSIKFITATRTQTESGLSATFSVDSSDIYVRVEVSNGSNTLFSNAIML